MRRAAPSLLSTALVAAAMLAAGPAEARGAAWSASEPIDTGNEAYWAATTMETGLLATAGLSVGLVFAAESRAVIYASPVIAQAVTPIVSVSLAVGATAAEQGWSHRPPLAFRGGLFGMTGGVALGLLLDGHRGGELRMGTWTPVLGLAGLGAGALVGAYGLKTRLEGTLFYLAPYAGAALGLGAFMATTRWRKSVEDPGLRAWRGLLVLAAGYVPVVVASYGLGLVGPHPTAPLSGSSSSFLFTTGGRF